MKEQAITSAVKQALVPITLTEEGKSLIDRAILFQKRHQCNITLLLAYETDEGILPSWMNPFAKKGANLLPAEEQMRMFVLEKLGAKEIPEYMHLQVMNLSLPSAVKSIQGSNRHDMILLSKKIVIDPSTGEIWETGMKLIIREAHCPVLTFTHPEASIKPSKIMLPIDLFEPHRGKLIWAERLAQTYGASVHIVSAIKKTLDIQESKVYQKIKEARHHLEQVRIKTETTVLFAEGDKCLNDLIPEFINQTQAGLTIIMTHKESIFDFNYVGRVASGVILKTESPIFCISPEKSSFL